MTTNLKPQSTMELIAQIESGGNQYALRFEPTFSIRLVDLNRVKKFNQVSVPTLHVINKTSWGMFQIMGANIYALGYQKQIGEFICNLDDQKDVFKKFLVKNGIDYSINDLRTSQDKRENFAKRYNGSVLYAQKIEAFL